MPPPVPWVTKVDRYVLDMLDHRGTVITPKGVWLSLRQIHGDDDAPSREQISRRLRNELSDYGLVHQPFVGEERGYYELTELGERFLHASDATSEEFVADIDDEPVE
ncbi:MAG TPA: hypothetical protein VFJ06_08565 [Halococcus sp.]|nr:hypothetical protein [Halococcus sp.]